MSKLSVKHFELLTQDTHDNSNVNAQNVFIAFAGKRITATWFSVIKKTFFLFKKDKV